MNINRMRIAYASLNGVATKVFHAVPLCEAWTASQILGELRRQQYGYSLDVVEGSLAKVVDAGLVRQNGSGPGRTFQSLYSPTAEDFDEKPMTQTKPPMDFDAGGVIAPEPSKPSALERFSSIAADARALSKGLAELANAIEDAALQAQTEIDKAGAAGAELAKLKAVFRSLSEL